MPERRKPPFGKTRRHSMKSMQTELLPVTPSAIARASQRLREGALVAFPTETVYGLGADASNTHAVANIFEAKGRPSFNPLIVHVSDLATAKRYAEWNAQAENLAQAFWPGPLTLVLPRLEAASLSSLVTAGAATVAIRVPAHPVAQSLLKQFDGAIAAPSANPSGQISPTRAAHVIEGLGNMVSAVLDAGPCDVGLESTIVGIEDAGSKLRLLRPGGLAREDIEQHLGAALETHQTPGLISAPGQLASHYAPKARLRLNATDWTFDEKRLGFGDVDCDLNLSTGRNLTEAACNLFHCLHLLDAGPATTIAVSPIPNIGLGQAINDRLQRAAAPR